MNRLEQLLERLREFGDRQCLDGEAGSHTYTDLLREYRNWLARFDALGLTAGAVVGLRTDYSLAAVAALLALFSRGCVAALIPRDRDASGYLRDARAVALLDLDTDGTHRWEPLAAPTVHPLLALLRDAGNGGVVIFTSGSSGTPKAALQSVERFLHKFQRPGRALRTLGFLLFDHVAGLDTLLYTLSHGGTLVVTRSRDPAAICALIERYRVEVLPASPSFLRLLCLADNAGTFSLASLKVITYGSEPMGAYTLEMLNKRFPLLQISQKYGTTETGSPRSESRAKDSAWIRLKTDDVETRVVDGVLWIRSEGTILGYLNAASPVDSQGWYCTGDLVDTDGDWIRIRGRESDVINVGGEKVAPAEIEQVILSLDFVREAVVAGEPSALLGQIVTAQVALAGHIDAKEAVKAIRAHCRERLAKYKVPVKIAVVAGGLSTERQKARRLQSAG